MSELSSDRLEAESECRIPLYRYGELYASKSMGSHDWRLLSRERTFGEAQGINIPQAGWRETWYCTRCRYVEEREVEL